jgi:hypothetical protein
MQIEVIPGAWGDFEGEGVLDAIEFGVSAGVLLFRCSAICADTGAAVAILQEKCLACHGESSASVRPRPHHA